MLGRDCWFCDRGEDVERLVFDCEFDTPVHVECIRKALARGSQEAESMRYLLGDEENEAQEK